MTLNFSCDICNKTLSSKDKLKTHIIKVHKFAKNTFYFCHFQQCPQGSKLFRDQASFKKHCDEHSKTTEAKGFQCGECGKCVTTKYKLKDHFKATHGVGTKEFKCKKCPKEFVTKSTLQNHIKKCGINQDFTERKCSDCGKSFTDPSNLNRHITVVHKGLKKIPCDICNDNFKSQNQLNIHKKYRHTSLKDKSLMSTHHCEHCGMTCGQKTNSIDQEKEIATQKSLEKSSRIDPRIFSFESDVLQDIKHEFKGTYLQEEIDIKLEDEKVLSYICGKDY